MEAITFLPLLMDRVWGGRVLEERFGIALPDGVPIGESWELCDRPEAQSVVTGGTSIGTTLHELWTQRREEVFGARGAASGAERCPLLIKLLDASATLSVQVHPPVEVAAALDGEPKSEMWFVADTAPGAHLLVGLREGVTRAQFEAALKDGGDVSTLLHRLDVSPGDAIYLPSGRVHAIGAGCLIVEIQQNSDTTYRVYDFDRPGLDGKPRQLHVEESLRSIDFDDVEPPLLAPGGEGVCATEFFSVERWTLSAGEPRRATSPGECAAVVVLDGDVRCGPTSIDPGRLALVPAQADDPELHGPGEVLVITFP